MAFPVLMVSVVELKQWSLAGPLPNIPPNTPFWAQDTQQQMLISSGLAVLAPPNTTAPPAEPPHTVNGVPGLGAGTSNSSY